MNYLLVKKDAYDYLSQFSVVKNQLLTIREYHKFCPYISRENFYSVDINRNHTHKMYGVRYPVCDAIVHFRNDGKNLIFCGSGTTGKFYETILI